MRKPTVILVAIVLTIGIWELTHHSSSSSRANGPSATVHAAAPNFSLQDLEGKPLDLANYHGKVVLLDFWATWCTPCRDGVPHFVEFQDKYHEQGLQVIGISMDDDPKSVREFYKEFKMNYPVALGNEKVAEAYGGVLGLPITFLIDRDGRVAAKYVGGVEMPAIEQKIRSLLQTQ